MSRKKLLILAFIFSFILALFAAYLFFAKNKTATVSPPGNSINSAPSGQAPITPSASLPTSTNNQQSSQSLIIVANKTSAKDIKDAFSSFSAKKPVKNLEWTKLTDTKNQPVSLNSFSQAIGIKINSRLNDLLDTNKFDLFSCPSANGATSFGMVLNIKLMPSYKGNLFQTEVQLLKDWEKSLFPDIANAIFPNTVFTAEQLQQKITFQKGKYNYAEILLPDGEKNSINYALLDDYIIFASSKDCLDRVSGELLSITN